MADKKPLTNTGDEKKALRQLRKLLRTIDTIGGTVEADNIRKQLDSLLVDAYNIITTGKVKR